MSDDICSNPTPCPLLPFYFTYLENQLSCSWCEYPSTLVPGLLTTAHPLLVLPPFHNPQIKSQYLHRQHQQYQPSSSDTLMIICARLLTTFCDWHRVQRFTRGLQQPPDIGLRLCCCCQRVVNYPWIHLSEGSFHTYSRRAITGPVCRALFLHSCDCQRPGVNFSA